MKPSCVKETPPTVYREEMLDTMCNGCGKWLHKLTPGGRGNIFCDDRCKKKSENRWR